MKVTFRPPNFECQVSLKYSAAKKKKKEWVLCYAPDEDQARKLLDELNYDTYQVRPHDFETGWRQEARKELKKADNAVKSAIAAGRKPIYEGQTPDYEFNEGLWKKLRVHLVWLFHNKCAYCQIYLGNDVRVSQIEHYRPKSAVDGEPNHPGYWWLAYEPTNYLPSCTICNGYVKGNQFPMMEGSQYISIITADLQNESAPVDLYQDLAAEQPVIINPFQDDPDDYLDFLPVGKCSPGAVDCPGTALPKNDRGKKEIDLMKFNANSMLLKRRREIQQKVYLALLDSIGKDNVEAAEGLIQDIKEGNQEFYTAAKAEVRAYYKRWRIPDPFQ